MRLVQEKMISFISPFESLRLFLPLPYFSSPSLSLCLRGSASVNRCTGDSPSVSGSFCLSGYRGSFSSLSLALFALPGIFEQMRRKQSSILLVFCHATQAVLFSTAAALQARVMSLEASLSTDVCFSVLSTCRPAVSGSAVLMFSVPCSPSCSSP